MKGKHLILMSTCIKRSQGIELQDPNPIAIAIVPIMRICLEGLNTVPMSPLLATGPFEIDKLQPSTVNLIIIHGIIKVGI
jgi:hypothetical protein